MLSDIFRTTITVTVTPEVFRFSTPTVATDIRTYLLIFEGRILGIGDDFDGSDRCQRIDLFDPDSPSFPDKEFYLEAFMRFGVRKVLKRKFKPRPRMFLRNTDSLRVLCCGYQNSILKAAAMNGGAYECEIEGEPRG